MRIRSYTGHISATLVDSYLWGVRRYLRSKCGVDAGDRALYPLKWYVDTGRASADWLGHLVQVKQFVIGRILLGGGSDDEIIRAITARIYRED